MPGRTPTPDRAAADLVALAGVIRDGRWRRALELADANSSPLRSTAGSDGGAAIGTHSDPTAAAALHQRHDHIPHAAELVSAMDGVRAAMGVRGGSSMTWVEGRLIGRCLVLHARMIATGQLAEWEVLWRHVDRCLVLHARVITPDAAAAHQAEKDRARTLRRCTVCESPMPDHDRHDICSADRWLWDDAQRNVKGRLRWTNHAEAHHTDWARFVDWVRARIADPAHVDNRIPLTRPGSPFTPTG
jgi:hypothetical protein